MLHKMDAYWRAANYLSIGQIHLYDNPLLKLIHRLTYRRTNQGNIHFRGYEKQGTITTPFDMTVLNDLNRFHLVMDTIDRLPQTGDKGDDLKQQLKDKLIEHKQYINKYAEDLPEIRNRKWSRGVCLTKLKMSKRGQAWNANYVELD
jgi:phosphoketolase